MVAVKAVVVVVVALIGVCLQVSPDLSTSRSADTCKANTYEGYYTTAETC